MPKIPTFTRRTEITTEAPTLRTSIQVSPTATPAAALLPVAESVQSYFIKQRDNNEMERDAWIQHERLARPMGNIQLRENTTRNKDTNWKPYGSIYICGSCATFY